MSTVHILYVCVCFLFKSNLMCWDFLYYFKYSFNYPFSLTGPRKLKCMGNILHLYICFIYFNMVEKNHIPGHLSINVNSTSSTNLKRKYILLLFSTMAF